MAFGCTQKKNTVVTRNYHNLTSRFNGYFYAKESMKEGLTKLDQTYEDDYSQLLPLYKSANTPAGKGIFPEMEKAIKKSSTVIERHAITDRGGTEIAGANKWIDDNYLLIGRARFYKSEFLSALETFEYVSRKYPKDPIRYYGYLWQAKTHLELGGYSQAEPLLDLIANDKAAPEEMKPDIKATYADLYMRTGNYGMAIKHLEEAIALTQKKKERVRFTYVLGQLYQKTGNTKKASTSFAKVIDMNPEYTMLFNAKINRARMSGADPAARDEAKRDLDKLLKDPKNKEYYDQIYFTLGEIEQRAGREDIALKYYKLSTVSSMGNDRQKAISYLSAADIYFSRTEYSSAQLYYDSSMRVLPKNYPDYNAIDDKRKSLNNLVKYLNLITFEDSVQNVVNLYGSDTTKLYGYIDQLIERQKELDKKKEQQQSQDPGSNFSTQFPGTGGGTGTNNNNPGGTWYWYNISTIASGLGDFQRKWGNRKLEDNWRRSNKETILETGDGGAKEDTSQVATQDKGKPGDNKTRAYYLKNLPLTAEQMGKSNERIVDAYYNLGSIYKEQLRNNKKSIASFEKLTERFPKHKYSLPSHYQLYRLYLVEKDRANAEVHSAYILKNFPESEYAQILKNPNYERNVLGDKEKVTKYYNETFEIYSAGRYQEVISRADYADTAFGRNYLSSRFDYLRALSLGHTQGVDALSKALTQIIIKHPKDAIKDEAQHLLDRIKGVKTETKKDTGSFGNASFRVNDNTEYQYMLVVDNNKGNLNKFRSVLSDYNNTGYASLNLSVNSMLLDPTKQLVLVKPFPNKTAALDYYNLLKSKPQTFVDLQANTYQAFIISTENIPILFKDKNVDAYKQFFEQNIVKKTP